MAKNQIAAWLNELERRRLNEIQQLRPDLHGMKPQQIVRVALMEWFKEQLQKKLGLLFSCVGQPQPLESSNLYIGVAGSV